MNPDIEIFVNGESQLIAPNRSIADLLSQLEIEGRIAVDVNGEIIPRSEHAEYCFSSNDRVEIVHAIGGGSYSTDITVTVTLFERLQRTTHHAHRRPILVYR